MWFQIQLGPHKKNIHSKFVSINRLKRPGLYALSPPLPITKKASSAVFIRLDHPYHHPSNPTQSSHHYTIICLIISFTWNRIKLNDFVTFSMFYSLKQPRWLSMRHATRYPHPSELPTNHLLWYAEWARARGRERDIYMIFVRNIFLDNGGPENSGKHSHGDIDDICKINLTPFFSLLSRQYNRPQRVHSYRKRFSRLDARQLEWCRLANLYIYIEGERLYGRCMEIK